MNTFKEFTDFAAKLTGSFGSSIRHDASGARHGGNNLVKIGSNSAGGSPHFSSGLEVAGVVSLGRIDWLGRCGWLGWAGWLGWSLELLSAVGAVIVFP
ncbi:hypothetical protein [Corynebacterium auriscanis]|uniref:hypothetical protein n=1 Tax=Corynebacterium auriscanis TaxID=99807 RepID=UPI003CF8AF10